MSAKQKLEDALRIIRDLGLPRAQHNERTALCILALCDMTPEKAWCQATAPFMGITPIMDWSRDNYSASYAPNTRETFRRQSIHQLIAAGICIYNPDDPARAVNSPKAVYQITPEALALFQLYDTAQWQETLQNFLHEQQSLVKRYACEREMAKIPVALTGDAQITLSPGVHSELIRAIIEDFAPYFAPGSQLVYAGDTGDKWGYFDETLLASLGVSIDSHGKMPDVVLYFQEKNWLLLVEAVTSHGPVDGKRHEELVSLFMGANSGLVYVTAFPNRAVMARYLNEIAWETEVWVADAPTHLIHFNGNRFLGPHE